jgi:drug/metabolite transporter (DMT)-like permease
MSDTLARPPRRAKHLIDPTAPRPVRDLRRERESLTRVQQWIMSTLVVTTGLHMAAGLIVAAMFLDERGAVSQIGLNVIAGVFGVISVAAALAIHHRRWLSPWLLVGVLPTFVGLWLTFR